MATKPFSVRPPVPRATSHHTWGCPVGFRHPAQYEEEEIPSGPPSPPLQDNTSRSRHPPHSREDFSPASTRRTARSNYSGDGTAIEEAMPLHAIMANIDMRRPSVFNEYNAPRLSIGDGTVPSRKGGRRAAAFDPAAMGAQRSEERRSSVSSQCTVSPSAHLASVARLEDGMLQSFCMAVNRTRDMLCDGVGAGLPGLDGVEVNWASNEFREQANQFEEGLIKEAEAQIRRISQFESRREEIAQESREVKEATNRCVMAEKQIQIQLRGYNRGIKHMSQRVDFISQQAKAAERLLHKRNALVRDLAAKEARIASLRQDLEHMIQEADDTRDLLERRRFDKEVEEARKVVFDRMINVLLRLERRKLTLLNDYGVLRDGMERTLAHDYTINIITQCPLCGKEIPSESTLILVPCGHTLCPACVKEHTLASMHVFCRLCNREQLDAYPNEHAKLILDSIARRAEGMEALRCVHEDVRVVLENLVRRSLSEFVHTEYNGEDLC